MMLKNVSVRGEEFLLRSEDGKAWFASPSDVIDYRRRRSHEREKLRRDFLFAVDHGWNKIRKARQLLAETERGKDIDPPEEAQGYPWQVL